LARREGAILLAANWTVSTYLPQCLIFDDSFDHQVWNKGATDRVILLIDFWHPDLTQREIEVITRLLPALETPHEKDFT
jgi:hypothetical protein